MINMDLFKAAIHSVATGVGNYVSRQSKEEKLREQLYKCTYSDDVKFMIEKAVKQVLNVYPHFETQILEFTEKGHLKRFLEIKGIMEIQIRGKICKVDYNMMLPSTFPTKAPYVRIINQNSEYIVDKFYQALRSPTDPKSYLLNERLDSVKKWSKNSSIVNIIIESHNMMRNNFPFNKPPSNSGGQGFNSGWGGMNMQPQNNWQNNQQNYNQYGGQGGFVRPPIPFNANSGKNTAEVIAEGQKFVGSSKKIMEKLKSEHIKSIEKIQNLETMRLSLASEEEYIRGENMNIMEFLRQSQNSAMRDLSELVRPLDARSEQILELTSNLKARDDCMGLLEEKFNNEEIKFEEFMKLAKKVEQEKFQEKVLLAKCIQYARS